MGGKVFIEDDEDDDDVDDKEARNYSLKFVVKVVE